MGDPQNYLTECVLHNHEVIVPSMILGQNNTKIPCTNIFNTKNYSWSALKFDGRQTSLGGKILRYIMV